MVEEGGFGVDKQRYLCTRQPTISELLSIFPVISEQLGESPVGNLISCRKTGALVFPPSPNISSPTGRLLRPQVPNTPPPSHQQANPNRLVGRPFHLPLSQHHLMSSPTSYASFSSAAQTATTVTSSAASTSQYYSSLTTMSNVSGAGRRLESSD